MIDHYEILGISKEASIEEIQIAYKKLSILFNQQIREDDFYKHHFTRIQAAFQVLSDEEKKRLYDKQFKNQPPKQSKEKPRISAFSASKDQITSGELITINWTVDHAQDIFINLIGNVPASGTKTIRLLFESEETFKDLRIDAQNDNSHQPISKKIRIFNQELNIKPQSIKKQAKLSVRSNSSTINQYKAQGAGTSPVIAYVVILIMLIFMAYLIYQLHLINPIF